MNIDKNIKIKINIIINISININTNTKIIYIYGSLCTIPQPGRAPNPAAVCMSRATVEPTASSTASYSWRYIMMMTGHKE